jgi:hypothetical protein
MREGIGGTLASLGDRKCVCFGEGGVICGACGSVASAGICSSIASRFCQSLREYYWLLPLTTACLCLPLSPPLPPTTHAGHAIFSESAALPAAKEDDRQVTPEKPRGAYSCTLKEAGESCRKGGGWKQYCWGSTATLRLLVPLKQYCCGTGTCRTSCWGTQLHTERSG